ncbi:tetratricopeptide repeat protein [Nocardiopsis aegyptia]|uniref:tetratricopeptide repeat protein n=1 Tax=Nocardiopsis aegyptia TaxID=220378 RepID=UPI003672CF83
MASPPDAHDNAVHGAVSGQLVQARDIHGGVTINVPSPPPAPAPLSDVSLDPPRLATAVRGRDELLAELVAAMKVGAPVPHVLTGPGGFGKTTVAAALAERARADGWAVFWVRPGNVAASMLEAAVELGGSREEAEQVRPTRHQAARWVWRHLDRASRPWLLVIDNADRPEELDPENRPGDQLGWMRASPGGFVLVTSRVDDPAQWAPARVHRLGELDGDAAATALADHAGQPVLAGADELAARLGGVPLALFLAGRILATHRILFPDANALLAKLDQDVSALDELAAPFVTGDDAERRLLSGVWELSLCLVSEKDPHATPLLRILAILGSDDTDIPLRRLPVSELRGGVLDGLDEAGLARAINALVVHGLVTVGRHQGETSLRLHPLVSETVRAALTDGHVPVVDAAERLLGWQRHHDPLFEVNGYGAIVTLRTRLHPEAPQSIISGLKAGLRSLQEAFIQRNRLLILLGRTYDAERNLARYLNTTTESLGPHDPHVLRIRHHIAEVWLLQGRVDDAESEYLTLLDLSKDHLGPEHENTLDARFQLGLIAVQREQWETAVESFRALMDDWQRLSGTDDPRTLAAWENLAYAVMCQGDAADAEREFQQIRLIRSRAMGERHPLTAQSDYYLARAAFEGGDLVTARTRFEACLEIREAALGTDHPDTQRTRTWVDRSSQALREGR